MYNNEETNIQFSDKRILNLEEFCLYLGIGKTKAREILTKQPNKFVFRIGNRLYANKKLLDKWIDDNSGLKKGVANKANY